MPWGTSYMYRIDVSPDTSAARENTIPPLSDFEELVTLQCTDNKTSASMLRPRTRGD